jgi:hypothetical protein
VPTIAMPMDLASEPGNKAAYWFVTLSHTVASQEMLGARQRSPRMSGWLAASQMPSGVEAMSATGGVCAESRLAPSTSFQPFTGLDATGERALLQIVATENAPACAEQVKTAVAKCRDLGLMGHVMLACNSVEILDGAVLMVHDAPAPVMTTIRTAIHEGVRILIVAATLRAMPTASLYCSLCWDGCISHNAIVMRLLSIGFARSTFAVVQAGAQCTRAP